MNLGQFYTPAQTGITLIDRLEISDPLKVCDIGAGLGDLLCAVNQRWTGAKLLAADIDPLNVAHARSRLPAADCHQVDALRHDLPRLLGVEEESMDVAVGNPPYGALRANASHLSILRDAGLSDAVSPKRLTRDIVFLAQNLRLLKHGGELAVILPEGLAVNHVYADLRAALLERHGLWRALELPAFLFKGTEAKTVALFLRKGTASHSVLLESSGGASVRVDAEKAKNRLDAQFHLQSMSVGLTLADLNPDIKRGALSHAEFRELGVPIFHTTDFKRFQNGRAILGRAPSMADRWVVTPGDILIPRVGSRCLAHAAMVVKGKSVFTDCVYRIRVATEWREHLLRALRSEQGVRFRLAVSHGTCAASLSKNDLLSFPLE